MLRQTGTGALGEILYELYDYQYPRSFSYLYYRGNLEKQYHSTHTSLLQILKGEEFVWNLQKEAGCTSFGTMYESVWFHKLKPGINIVSGTYCWRDPTWIESLSFTPIAFSELNKLRQGIRIRE